MKVYVEDVTEQEHEDAGVQMLSLIQGMSIYRAEVRDSDITLFDEEWQEVNEEFEGVDDLLHAIEQFKKEIE